MRGGPFSFDGGSSEFEGDSVCVRRQVLGSVFVVNGRLREARPGFTFVLYFGLAWGTERLVMLALAEERSVRTSRFEVERPTMDLIASTSECRAVDAADTWRKDRDERLRPAKRALRLNAIRAGARKRR